jgi:hypothetical protein
MAAIALGFCSVASGQEPVQTLDRVQAYSVDSVLEMNFDDPRRLADFDATGISGSNFRACKMTALDGLYCLDGNLVRHWPDPDDAGSFETVVDCEDPVLGLDNRKGDACTSLTADLAGALFVGATKRSGRTLVKVVEKPTTGCPAGFDALQRTDYCADEIVSGRGRLDDLVSIDGDTAVGFNHGKGILALEDGKTAVFFKSAGGAPVVIASGKSPWGLQGNEQLLSVTLLQVANGAVANYVLAVTTTGRVLAKNTTGSGSATAVFNVGASRESTSVQCDAAGADYGIRTSSKSGLIYVTDRQYCEVVALVPVAGAGGSFSHLTNAREPVLNQAGDPTGQLQNLTLSTAAGAGTYPPEGPTIAPGISIDLSTCQGFCPLVLDENGDPAASLSNVSLASQESGLTLFQIRNIPDCRYIPQVCRDLLNVTDLVAAGVVVNLPGNGAGDPAGQILNMTRLLPREVTELFDASGTPPGGLPPMYMSRQHRGQSANGFTFDAFFGVTEDGVIFDKVFNGEFEVAALAGTELGCQVGLPIGTPLGTLLQWDTVTTVSEKFIGIDGKYIDTLINTDCGSSRTSKTRWSIVPYNTEITPCTYNAHNPGDVWVSDGACPVGGPEQADDAVFAKLLLSLYDDLGDALTQLACTNVDGGSNQPLSGSSCATLQASWLNGKDKLDKCWNATQQPKNSAGDQTCQGFLSQLGNFASSVAATPRLGTDPANRKSELSARVEVILHVYHERFVPSLSAAGFCEPGNPAYPGC